jgi:hypothetical protein
MLSDFEGLYDLAPDSVVVTPRAAAGYDLRFPKDIRPDYLFYLVNYLVYPKGFDLKGRAIGVLCHTRVTAAFGPPETSIVGREVEIYVPAPDEDYDRVYARVEGHATYIIPFTDLIWQTTSDPRRPDAIAGL